MKVFNLFNMYGVFCGTSSDEVYASVWADFNEGSYTESIVEEQEEEE